MSLSASGRRTQKTALNEIARMLAGEEAAALTCNWAAVRYPHAAAIRTRLAETYAPATANKMLSALRRVLKEAWKLGYMSAEEYQRAVSVANVPGQTLPPGRELGQGEIYSLMLQCASDNSPAGVRDAAMIALLYSCGLRRAEIVALDLAAGGDRNRQAADPGQKKQAKDGLFDFRRPGSLIGLAGHSRRRARSPLLAHWQRWKAAQPQAFHAGGIQHPAKEGKAGASETIQPA